MATDIMYLFPSEDVYVGHNVYISPRDSDKNTSKVYSLINKNIFYAENDVVYLGEEATLYKTEHNDEECYYSYIYAKCDDVTDSSKKTYKSRFKLSSNLLPSCFNMSVNSCEFKVEGDHQSNGTCINTFDFYVDGILTNTIVNTEDGTVSSTDTVTNSNVLEIFSATTETMTESDFLTAINNYLIANNYTKFPTIEVEITSEIYGTATANLETHCLSGIDALGLKIKYDTNDSNSFMRGGRIFLRPVSDIIVGHTLEPSDSTEAYVLLNEEEVDGVVTSIKDIRSNTVDFTSGNLKTSKFELGCDQLNSDILKTISIKNIRLFKIELTNALANNVTGTSNGVVTIDDSLSVTTEISGEELNSHLIQILYMYDMTQLTPYIVECLAENGIFPYMTFTHTTDLYYIEDPEEKERETYISALSNVYLAVDYEIDSGENPEGNIGICKKVDGSWLVALQAFQKQNGAWVELTEAECKNILQNI